MRPLGPKRSGFWAWRILRHSVNGASTFSYLGKRYQKRQEHRTLHNGSHYVAEAAGGNHRYIICSMYICSCMYACAFCINMRFFISMREHALAKIASAENGLRREISRAWVEQKSFEIGDSGPGMSAQGFASSCYNYYHPSPKP